MCEMIHNGRKLEILSRLAYAHSPYVTIKGRTRFTYMKIHACAFAVRRLSVKETYLPHNPINALFTYKSRSRVWSASLLVPNKRKYNGSKSEESQAKRVSFIYVVI